MAESDTLMPYYISDKAEGCSGWAVVKADGEVLGCHTTKDAAIKQGVAVSLAEDEEFMGELDKRDLSGEDVIISDIDGTLINAGRRVDRVWEYIQSEEGLLFLVTGRPESTRDETVKQLADLDITYSRLIMNDGSTASSNRFKKATAEKLLETYNITMAIENNPTARAGYRSLGIETYDPATLDSHDESDSEEEESRAVDLTAPAFMRAAARRGLKLYEEGKGGDGLVDATIREARAMAAGNVTADKWTRISAWIARHMVDLDAPKNNDPSHPDYPGAGLVAHLLWGSSGTKRGAERTKAYADRIIARLDEESKRGNSMSKREIRTSVADIEIRESGNGMTFSGYAAVFNSPSEPLPFIERIARGAFQRSLKSRNEVKLLWNHDMGQVLGSLRAGTLRLFEDNHGLRVEADLPDTQLGRDTATLLRRGDISSMSFGFTVPAGGDTWNSEGTERTLKSVRLFEVSIVSMPAYTSTTASVRAYDVAAKRASLNVDDLADVMLKIEEGVELTADEAKMVADAASSLVPPVEEKAESAPESTETNNDEVVNLLDLKRKQLDLMLKKGL